MAHDHKHQHHVQTVDTLNRAFIIGIILNAVFIVAEFAAGFWSNSMGLISDAGHNLSDVASLILAMIAFRLVKVRSNHKYTYGYKKSTILVSLFNAIILLIAVVFILIESIEKLMNPQPVEGIVITIVAGIGVIINGITARLFINNKDKDLNVKGAYLHMIADALVSVGVVISGIVILITDWVIIDAIIGIVIAGIIVYSTWGLLNDSIRLVLDGVPSAINFDEIVKAICSEKHVVALHHIHIWAISTTENALTAHIVIDNIAQMEPVKEQLRLKLKKLEISHVTLEFELQGTNCTHENDDEQQCNETKK
ncbi:MAG: cation diffusion facilitator family transporter [Lentimicrobiaceae bacterium]|jgi:cobalt-zinc-cadmium efflux system protein|nr:cation diffusion facilitator family transporter [Lentimicrobiaceae bacterium]